MSHPITGIDKRVDEALAEARAIRFATLHGAISYEEAKNKAEKLLEVVNEAGQQIARKNKRRYRKIRFTDL